MKDPIVTTQPEAIEPETTEDEYPEQPYGKCSDCGKEVASRDELSEHLKETQPEVMLVGSKSHSVRIVNPTRAEKARNRVGDVVQAVLDDAMDEIESLLFLKEATREDIKKALVGHPDFADAWAEYIRERDAEEEWDEPEVAPGNQTLVEASTEDKPE